MPGVIGVVVLIAIGAYVYVRMVRSRRELAPELAAPEPERLSRRRQRHLEKIREFDDAAYEPKTMEQLVAEEVAETGVDEIAGGAELATPVKLKVFHRDSPAHPDCRESGLRFEVSPSTTAPAATVADVRLLCDADHPPPPPPSVPSSPDESGDDEEAP
jgi:hypothetical protein